MNSTIKTQAREGVDALFELVEGCRFVMLLDTQTALVLCANSEASLSQDARNDLAVEACDALRFPDVSVFEKIGSVAETHSVTRFGTDGVTIALKKTGVDDVAMVCQFDAAPAQADLDAAANDVLGLFQNAEAA